MATYLIDYILWLSREWQLILYCCITSDTIWIAISSEIMQLNWLELSHVTRTAKKQILSSIWTQESLLPVKIASL